MTDPPGKKRGPNKGEKKGRKNASAGKKKEKERQQQETISLLLTNLIQTIYKEGAQAEAQEKFKAVVKLDQRKYYLSIIPEKIAQAERDQEIERSISEFDLIVMKGSNTDGS